MKYLKLNYLVIDEEEKQRVQKRSESLGISPSDEYLDNMRVDTLYLSEEDVRSITKIIPMTKVKNYTPYEIMIEKLIGNVYTNSYIPYILQTENKDLVEYIHKAIKKWDKEDLKSVDIVELKTPMQMIPLNADFINHIKKDFQEAVNQANLKANLKSNESEGNQPKIKSENNLEKTILDLKSSYPELTQEELLELIKKIF